MIGRKTSSSEKGFSLIELLFVIGILAFMMTLGLLVWVKTAPAIKLESAIQSIAADLTFARTNALKTGNNWFVEFDLDKNCYYIVNDDGWLGTVTGKDQFGNLRNPRSYYLGSPDFDESKRNNGVAEDDNSNGQMDIGDREVIRGPIYAGKEMFLMKVSQKSIKRVTFNRNGVPEFIFEDSTESASKRGEVWVATAYYYTNFSSTDPTAGTKDDQRYRRAVKVTPRTGMIKVLENK